MEFYSKSRPRRIRACINWNNELRVMTTGVDSDEKWKSEEQSRNLIRFKKQSFISTKSGSDSDREGQTARASSKLEPKMASFHSSAPAPKKNSRAKKLGSGSKIENQSQKARLWLQNKTNQSQKLGSGSRIFLRLDHQWPKCYIGNVCVILNHYQSITLVISVEHSTITKALHW